MLIVETIARIRREHFIKGKTIKEIARDLKVSRNRVRKVLRSGETSFEYERVVQPRPKLGRWAAELDGLLAGNAAKAAREQLTLIRIFEELRGLPDGGFHFLAAILFSPDYTVDRAAIIPHALVLQHSTRVEHTNSWKFLLRDAVWTWPGVEDVTSTLRSVEF